MYRSNRHDRAKTNNNSSSGGSGKYRCVLIRGWKRYYRRFSIGIPSQANKAHP